MRRWCGCQTDGTLAMQPRGRRPAEVDVVGACFLNRSQRGQASGQGRWEGSCGAS